MYESDKPIDQLVHLYVDGAFSRRQLVRRVARHTGGVTAALAALAGFEELRAQTPEPCPAGIKVPADAPDVEASDVIFTGEDGTAIIAHVAWPRNWTEKMPAVIVIHENRGLVEHIKDVTRRVARAGFVGIAPDLLSRQGGAAQFPEPTQQTQAYGRTTVAERRQDLVSTLGYVKTLAPVIHDRIGITGFCAGGANTWDFLTHVEELRAAVPFYGAPPPIDELPLIKTPVLAIYAERDRALTQRLFPVATAMIQLQKTFGMIVYEGVGHAFHNDTGANYNATAACDAWAQAMAFFRKFLLA